MKTRHFGDIFPFDRIVVPLSIAGAILVAWTSCFTTALAIFCRIWVATISIMHLSIFRHIAVGTRIHVWHGYPSKHCLAALYVVTRIGRFNVGFLSLYTIRNPIPVHVSAHYSQHAEVIPAECDEIRIDTLMLLDITVYITRINRINASIKYVFEILKTHKLLSVTVDVIYDIHSKGTMLLPMTLL